MLSVRKSPSEQVSVIVVEVAGNLTQLIQHRSLGTWSYQHAGRSYTREFTTEGFCILKDGNQVGWQKSHRVVDQVTVLVEDQHRHVLADNDTLNVESTFIAQRVGSLPRK